MPLSFETAREHEAAKAAARAELGAYPLRKFRHCVTGEVTEFLAKPGAVDRFLDNRSPQDFEEVDDPAGAFEMIEQHWGQA